MDYLLVTENKLKDAYSTGYIKMQVDICRKSRNEISSQFIREFSKLQQICGHPAFIETSVLWKASFFTIRENTDTIKLSSFV